MRGNTWKIAIGAAVVVGLAISVVAASGRNAAGIDDVALLGEEPARLAMLDEPASSPDPAPDSPFLSPLEPNTDDGKPVMLLGLDGWGTSNMEDPFLNIARGMGNVWSASQRHPGKEVMEFSELWAGGFIDPETMLPSAIPPGFDYVRTGLMRAGARHDPESYAGTYVVEWEGEAGKPVVDLMCQGSEKYPSSNRMEFTCPKSAGDWNNVKFPGLENGGLKSLRIYRKEHEAAVEAGEVFSPAFLEYAGRYKVLRALDIQASNIAAARSVDQLAKKSNAHWAADPRINYDGLPMGAPIEVLFDLAVAADSALWMNVSGPIGASERFDEIAIGGTRHRENFEQKLQMKWAEEEAPDILASPEWDKYADEVVRSLEASGYPETRALYIETANEVWNNANPFWWYRDYFLGISNWMKAQKPIDGYSTMIGVGYMEGRFALALEKALEKAARKQAVVFVLACQHANPVTCEGAAKGFRRFFEDAGRDAAPFLAAAGISTATYFHEGTSKTGLFKAANNEELQAKWLAAIASDPEGTAKALTDWYLNTDACCTIPYLVRMRKAQEEVAARYGLNFIGDYEGEIHDAAWEPLRNDPAFADWYFNVWMDGPEGERLTREWAKALYEENPDALIANYKGVARRQIRYPWLDGVYGQDTGRRRALEEFLRD